MGCKRQTVFCGTGGEGREGDETRAARFPDRAAHLNLNQLP